VNKFTSPLMKSLVSKFEGISATIIGETAKKIQQVGKMMKTSIGRLILEK